MGPTLSLEAKYTSASKILQEYRLLHMKEINQVLQDYQEMQREHGDLMAVTQDQFDHLFSIVCSDTTVHFKEFDKRGLGKVDVLEVFAVLIVFCNELVEVKIQALFALFDFDHTCYISHTELVMLMICCTRGLCRVVGLDRPGNLELECLANEAFNKIDTNRNNRISLSEFSYWLHHEHSVIQYLKKFASTRLIADAMVTYDNLLKQAIDLFMAASAVRHKSSVTTMEPQPSLDTSTLSYPACSPMQVRSVVNALKLPNLTQQDIDECIICMQSMVDEGSGTSTNASISLPNFCSVMSPAVAFVAADDDHSMAIDVHEFRILLWLMRKKEPTELQTKGMMLSLDEDENGRLSCMEWVHYASSTDRTTGSLAFNAQLSYLFEECDREGNGTIHASDFIAGLQTAVMRSVHAAIGASKKVDERKWNVIDELLASLAREIMERVDVNNSKTIEWKEFKSHLEFIEDRVAQVKSYVLTFVVS
ncbi:Aste57867_23809 [Aphanomyces stellatus]|uniref:Aste57867_23809 protein n=1 Tax=Aphanomyces stellatus TaxID=120398 RepID=A0A485LT57_9STRA|nr:hypothetical protein As57867_023736 [Aphanomyces stellatus]VFU00453.1 Aste57867_23809 [Aphanomyces stellatus]